MDIKGILEARKLLDSAKGKFGDAANKLEETKKKYSISRVKAIAVTLGVISLVLSCGAIAISVVALVKSCKAKKKYDVKDYSYYIDDDDDYEQDYGLNYNEQKISAEDVPTDEEEEKALL